MPPKRKASKKADDEDEKVSSLSSVQSDNEETKADAKPAKKAKKAKEPVKPLDSSLPTNMTFPTSFDYQARAEGCVRISSWNVCGLKSCEKKGFRVYVAAEDADILVLTETKGPDPNWDELSNRYPYRYFGVDPKKGHHGTAVLSKIEPINVTFGLPTSSEPPEASAGRIVTLEFPDTFVIGTYVQNAGEGLKNLQAKVAWNTAFEPYLRQLDAKKPVIWTGDLNCIPTEKDIRNWKTNHNKSPGVTDTEIDAFNAQLNPPEDSGHKKLVEVWRHLHPDLEGHYTYYSYRFQCRAKGIGWRLDHFVLSERLLSRVKACEIRHEAWGASDHLPLVLDIEGSL